MVRSEGNMSVKNPVTPSGIDPGTDRLEAQSLNHYATPDPSINTYVTQNQHINNSQYLQTLHFLTKFL